MSEMKKLKEYLIKEGASKVGFTNVEGFASELIDLPNGINSI